METEIIKGKNDDIEIEISFEVEGKKYNKKIRYAVFNDKDRLIDLIGILRYTIDHQTKNSLSDLKFDEYVEKKWQKRQIKLN